MNSMVHSNAKNRSRSQLLSWLPGLMVVLGFSAVFAALAEDVWFKESFAWDAPLMLAIHQYSQPWLDSLMSAVTQTGESIAIVFAVGLVLWFMWRRQMLDAATLAVGFGGAIVLNTLLKLLFARPRPTLFPPLVAETGYSFPSGHAIVAVALYGLMAVLLWRQRRWGWAILCSVWILVVALSRIYLGAHYPSDVLGSLSLGSLWLFVVMAARAWFQSHLDRQIGKEI